MRTAVMLAFLAVGASAGPERPVVEAVETVEAGLIDLQPVATEAAETLTGDVHDAAPNLRFKELTRRIPAKKGVGFGCRFRVVGQPEGAPADLFFVVAYPRPMRNPQTGRTALIDVVPWRALIGSTSVQGFKFGEAWQMMPGTWSLEVWQDDRLLAREKFEVAADGDAGAGQTRK